MKKPPVPNTTTFAVSEIADQLCATVDNNFDIHVSVDSDEIEIQKLCVLTNFLLESVRRKIKDLSDLSQSLEEQASERTRKLDLVVSGSNDGVWFWNLKSKTIEFSGRWLEMAGISNAEQELTPGTWFDRVHPNDKAALQSAIRSHLDGLSPKLNAEYRLRHESGLYRWMMCRGLTYRSESGTPELLAGTQTDITTLRGVDQSTGLPNEAYYNEVLQDFIDSKKRVFIGLARITRLHVLSETLDGPALDKLRRQIAERIMDVIPMEAILARLPGDVFALVIPNDAEDSDDKLRSICENLLKSFVKPFSADQAGEQNLDIAVGLTEMTENCILTRSEILGAAWTALRKATRLEERYCIFDLEAREHAFQLLRLERELRPALRKGMFEAHIQPIVSMNDRSIQGYEALMRLNHVELGMVPPDEFIPLAERSDIMIELGENILRQSVSAFARFIAGRPDAGNVYVSVNVSPVQLASERFSDIVENILIKEGLKAQNLRLEVTETAIVTNMDSALSHLQKLRSIGVTIALDDFGTGYSSLNYLRRLPIDVLKIDRSFISRIDSSDSKRAIVETIVGLARLLSIDVVAEGIETEQESAVLEQMRVDFGQGYLFGKPKEIDLALESHPQNGQPSNSVYQLKKAK